MSCNCCLFRKKKKKTKKTKKSKKSEQTRWSRKVRVFILRFVSTCVFSWRQSLDVICIWTWFWLVDITQFIVLIVLGLSFKFSTNYLNYLATAMCSPSLASTVGGDETSPPCQGRDTLVRETDHATSERARIHTHANVRTRAQECLGTQCQRRLQTTGSVIVFLISLRTGKGYIIIIF